MVSLGCKVNQAEAAHLERELTRLGWSPAEEGQPAALCLLLTCAVTATAGRQSRQMARRLRQAAPEGLVLACGCDVQAGPTAYVKDDVAVVGRAELAGLVPALAAGWRPAADAPLALPDSGEFCPGWRAPGPNRTRGLLKVQDGCDAGCAYCIVPSTRGKPRSLPADDAAVLLRNLAQAGAAEVVLTGIHLGRWGTDLPGGPGLVDLLRALLAAHPGPRLRLSSLEGNEATPELLELMAGEPRLCPHLHLPLQTGSDALLRAMGRPYGARDYAATLRAAAAALPGCGLGADVMVGLPGETEADFAATEALITELPLSYLHVFPYSPRPGTPAASFPNRVPGPLAKARAARLRRLGEAKRQAWLVGLVGQTLEVILEADGLGRAANYAPVLLDRPLPPGARLRVVARELVQGPAGLALRGDPA